MQAGEAAVQQGGQYEEAERIYGRGQAEEFGVHDRRVAVTLGSSCAGLQRAGEIRQAEPMYLEALKIYQDVHGENHSMWAAMLNNLGVLHRKHGQFADAQRLLGALAIKEMLGTEHLEAALALEQFGRTGDGSRVQAPGVDVVCAGVGGEGKAVRVDHPDVAKTLVDYAAALRKIGRSAEAIPKDTSR